MKQRQIWFVAGVAPFLALNPSFVDPAAAQTAASATPAATTSSDSGSLEEVVVNAQRRQENSQDVPIATSAVSADTAAALGITDPQTLVQLVPGLNFNRQANASIPFLRGIGTPVGQPGDEPSVAYFVDDVYVPAGAASLANFSNIDSIEVEKGPQGTLFGRNATGGVIQVTTKNPTQDLEADATAGYANYNTYSGSGYLSGGITDVLSANFAFYGSNQTQGWGKNQCQSLYGSTPLVHCEDDRPTDTGYDYGGRAKLLYQPSDQTSVLLSVDFDRTRTQEGLGFHAFPGTLSTGIFGGYAPPTGFYDTVEDEESYSVTTQQGASLKATQDIDWARLVSITAWRHTHAHENLDEDAGPLQLFDTHLQYEEQTWTQELQILSPEEKDAPISWIAGFFYMHDNAAGPYEFYGLGLGGPGVTADTTGTQITNSYSGFGQATFTVLPATHLTAGYRYTVDNRAFDATVHFPAVAAAGLPTSFTDLGPDGNPLPQSKSFYKGSYRLALDHNFTPDVLGYIAYNRGFKSGVYNTTVFPSAVPSPTQAAVAPETLDAYTIGAKTEFLDHHLRINAEGFYYQYKNIQIDQVVGAQTMLTNAAAADIKGVDLDVTLRPIENLTLNFSGEVLDGHYSSYPNADFNQYVASGANINPPGYNLSGNDTIQSPPVSVTISGTYVIPTDIGPFDLNLSWFHGGNYFFDPDNGGGQITSSNDRQPVLNLVNGSIGWSNDAGTIDARLWAKNITGQKYYSFVIEDAFATQYSPAPPTTFGISASYHFAVPQQPSPPMAATAPTPAQEPPPPGPVTETHRNFQVFFDFDKSAITQAAASVIRAAADAAKAGTNVHIQVVGHTDTVGTASYNKALSIRRADAVKGALVADGIGSGDIATSGVGKTDLLVPTKDGVREPQNRRATIELQ